MQDVIDYLFILLSNVWVLIQSNILLALSLMVIIFGLIVDIYNSTHSR